MTLGALAFMSPWILTGLLALPLIYWLLRTVPPRPRQIEFPPTRILVGIENREKTPAKTPWWLLLLRLLAAALIIFALADPILNPSREEPVAGDGPLVVVVDNGWSAAHRWAERMETAERFVTAAAETNRPVMILETAPAAKAAAARLESPIEARATLGALQPQPFAPDRAAAIARIDSAFGTANPAGASVIWLSDGIGHAAPGDEAFGKRLAEIASGGTFRIIEDAPTHAALALTAEVTTAGKLKATVRRTGGPALSGALTAYSAKDEQLGETPFTFADGETTTTATFELPLELRNQITRIAIAGNASAGAVNLLDSRNQWHRVALLSGESREQAQPLLGPLHYIEKALSPFAEIIKPKGANLAAGIDESFERNASILMLADIGTLQGEIAQNVRAWVEKGGLLVRFAGPRLEKGGDDLLPVPLRIGGRTLGGALSWSQPQPLAELPEGGAFAGLSVPEDVRINRQVLADPTRLGAELAVWARLEDGTPLVTARALGEGKIVLFHVTANSDWSNLPMSGLFVDMLRRITTLARLGSTADTGSGTTTNAGDTSAEASVTLANLPPRETLDGFGALRAPPPTARALTAAELDRVDPSLDHPPGYYGAGGSPRALNVLRAGDELSPLAAPSGAEVRGFTREEAMRLRPWLLAAALTLLLVDVLAVLLLQSGGRLFAGTGKGRTRAASAAAVVAATAIGAAAVAAAIAPGALNAQPAPAPVPAFEMSPEALEKGLRATSKVTLGYVVTGDPDVDDISRTGLSGLSRVLTLRTAVTPGDPMPVDIESDVIAFYPVLYWPVLDDAAPLEAATVAKIDAYMKQGGMIIFDTRDYGTGAPANLGLSGGESPLQRLLGRLDLPRLEPVPEGHVLTKSFYLLRAFPGRWDGGQLWVEAGAVEANEGGRQARRSDGVSSILITSNDFAAAWAIDERGRPYYPVVPGGERQREMAFRTGINIVMHALTGNYKADQVHVPALLERLGQ